MTKVHKKSFDLSSCISTESDSNDEREEEFYLLKTNPAKHKTELCKNFSELGRCPYGYKCRFAHGTEELVFSAPVKTFRKKKCNGFWQNGQCSYGVRCQFIHDHVKKETKSLLLGM